MYHSGAYDVGHSLHRVKYSCFSITDSFPPERTHNSDQGQQACQVMLDYVRYPSLLLWIDH